MIMFWFTMGKSCTGLKILRELNIKRNLIGMVKQKENLITAGADTAGLNWGIIIFIGKPRQN